MKQNLLPYCQIKGEKIMQFEMFTEVKLTKDLPEDHLLKGMTAIIVDYCPRPEGDEDGYILEVLDSQQKAFTVIAVEASNIESVVNSKERENQLL
jgi:hypothetical protein